VVYQRVLDDTAISQAYTIPAVVYPDDNGRTFQFVAMNSYGSQQSRVATLRVVKDTQRPKLLYAVVRVRRASRSSSARR